jgi:hypothetical protein
LIVRDHAILLSQGECARSSLPFQAGILIVVTPEI